LAVSRLHELWVVDVRTGARRLVHREARTTPFVVGWAGAWILFMSPQLPAISINLDGLPLAAVRPGETPKRLVRRALWYEDALSVCGGHVVVSAGQDRVTTTGKSLVLVAPPAWRSRTLARARPLSWVSPACSPGGARVAASAGRDALRPRFGLEARSLWLLSRDGRGRRKLTSPPTGFSDELPRWSADGRWLLFVRSGPTRGDATTAGTLSLVAADGSKTFASLGRLRGQNFYGHYSWARQTDWYRPR
jgi:hypothetical protein